MISSPLCRAHCDVTTSKYHSALVRSGCADITSQVPAKLRTISRHYIGDCNRFRRLSEGQQTQDFFWTECRSTCETNSQGAMRSYRMSGRVFAISSARSRAPSVLMISSDTDGARHLAMNTL